MKNLCLFFLCLLYSPFIVAQQERCGYIQSNAFGTTLGQQRLATFEARLQRYLEEKKAAGNNARTTGEVYQIPVIVHVVHHGEPIGEGANISSEQVYSQIEVLNEDFRKLNSDIFNTRPEFIGLAADAEIEFVLATDAPMGRTLTEPGIHRYHGDQESWNRADIEQSLKPATIYDPYRYLNIWTINFTNTSLLGEGQWPNTGVEALEGPQCVFTDGIMIGYQYFGSREKYPEGNYADFLFDKGRTATHEVGHWLGLRHTFEGCEQGDHVDDTPSQNASSSGCPSRNQQSCGSLDLWENFMDYTADDCMSLFTIDQVARMRAVLEFDPMRNSIIHPENNTSSPLFADLQERLTLYPNPSKGAFSLDFSLTCPYDIMSLRLVDVTGKELWRIRKEFVVSESLDFSAYPKGIYFLRVDIDGQRVVKRLILQ